MATQPKKEREFVRIVRTSAAIAGKVRKQPVAYPRRVAKMMTTDPRRVVRLALGREANPALIYALEKRAAIYDQWITENEPTEQELQAQRALAEKFNKQPLISIITPVFNPPVGVLKDLIESVLGQTYTNFELCLGDFGDSEDVRALIKVYAKQDARVNLYTFKDNKGISGNTNQLLAKVHGEFIGLLDHDDAISPNALYENVKKINEADYDFIYSDKDLIDDKGNRYEPLFKPELCYETMLNANYLTHFDIMRTSVVKKVGGWDSKSDGAQDWDLFLRIMIATDKFAHIPKVLYHWRVISTSTAHSIESKPYALAGQRYAVQKYLDAKGIKATPYHIKSELLLKWDSGAIDARPHAIILAHSVHDTLKLAKRLRKVIPGLDSITVLHSWPQNSTRIGRLKNHGLEAVYYKKGDLSHTFNGLLPSLKTSTLVYADDRVLPTKDFKYDELAGWLSINDVSIVGCKVLDEHNRHIIDSGSVLTRNGVLPLYKNCPAYYNGFTGNVEWTRNARVVSMPFFVAKLAKLNKVKVGRSAPDENVIAELMIRASQSSRLVVQPKQVVLADTHLNIHQDLKQEALQGLINEVLETEPQKGFDGNGSMLMSQDDPMLLKISDGISESLAVKVSHVNKTFILPHQKISSVKSAFLNSFRGKRSFEKQEVLQDISFSVKKGEFFGIVGRNGGGKSTLLKLLAGIYTPDSGSININGKLTPFIELGVGFNQELTGRENVYLNGALLGFSRKEVEAMYEGIVSFAELEKFMDQKLKNYSSGMQVRLAFSIAIRAKSDVLLIDEVLAVGDASFQKKCYDHFIKLKNENATVIFVSHDMAAVERFCDRVLVLNKGKITGIYKPREAAGIYDRLNLSTSEAQESAMRWGTGRVRITDVIINGSPENQPIQHGEEFRIKLKFDSSEKLKVVAGLAFLDDSGLNISGPNSMSVALESPGEVEYTIDKFPLNPGQYKLVVSVFDENVIEEYDHIENAKTIDVLTDSRGLYGKVDLFGKWTQ